MASYYAKIFQGFESERLVAVTGAIYGGLLRVIDVDIQGNPIGSATYLPSHLPSVNMTIGPDGYLVEEYETDSSEIDWAAHEDTEESEEEDVSLINPMLKAFPELL